MTSLEDTARAGVQVLVVVRGDCGSPRGDLGLSRPLLRGGCTFAGSALRCGTARKNQLGRSVGAHDARSLLESSVLGRESAVPVTPPSPTRRWSWLSCWSQA